MALGTLGAGATQSAYLVYRLGGLAEAQRCVARAGITLQDLEQGSPTTGALAAACTAGLNYRQGMLMLVGAGAMVLAAWTMMVCHGLVIRWRLGVAQRRSPATAACHDAAARFEAWCDALGLTGRRRPRLALSPSAGGEAFTTGLPLSRPVVVLPRGYAYLPSTRLDWVVLHELAHVRSRDLLWASSVWWTGWLGLPALLLALAPVLHRPSYVTVFAGPSLALVVALSVAILLLRAAVMRRRELAADRYANDVLGGHRLIRGILDVEPDSAPVTGRQEIGRRAWRWARGLLALHPPAAVRASGDRWRPERGEGGFLLSASVGLLSMYTFRVLHLTVMNLVGADVPGDLPLVGTLGVAGLLWAAVTVPAWTRRALGAAHSGSVPSWWGPVTGSAAGLSVGYCLLIPGLPVSGIMPTSLRLPLLLGVLAVATAGVAALAAGLAASAAASARPAVATAIAITPTALALTVLVRLVALPLSVAPADQAGLDRLDLFGPGELPVWRVVALVFFAACAAAGLAGAVPRRRLVETVVTAGPVVATAATIGGVAAALSWLARVPPHLTEAQAYYLTTQRLWVCALAGWTVTLVLLLAGSRSQHPFPTMPWAALPNALVAGFLTTTGAAILHVLILAARGYGFDMAVHSVSVPGWLLFVALIITLPALLAATHAAERGRRTTWRSPAGIRATLLGTAGGTTVLALALVGGLLTPVTIAPQDYPNALAEMQMIERRQAEQRAGVGSFAVLPPPAPMTPGEGLSGRLLNRDAADRAVRAAEAALPTGWQPGDDSPGEDAQIVPAACDELFERNAAAEERLPRSADESRSYRLRAPGTVSGITLSVALTSYHQPWRDFATTYQEAAQCPSFQVLQPVADSGRTEVTYTATVPHDLPPPALRSEIRTFSTVNGVALHYLARTDAILTGHNLVSVSVMFACPVDPPSEELRRFAAELAIATLTAVAADLHRR